MSDSCDFAGHIPNHFEAARSDIERQNVMEDMRAHLEKLRADAAECTLISDLATDFKKRELFARLAQRLDVLASELERAIADRLKGA
ncbi:MAG: hypothetical protein ACJ8EL_21015 [Rhizomicrobium sp.]